MIQHVLSFLPEKHRPLAARFIRYLAVGGTGFLIDAGGMELLRFAGLHIYAARALSMAFAMLCTYFLHRHLTFSDAGKPASVKKQAAGFVVAQLFANGTNYAIFCGILALLPEPHGFIARFFVLCIGTGVGLLLNFVLLSKAVFKKTAP
jgi:putative flippase GtrA